MQQWDIKSQTASNTAQKDYKKKDKIKMFIVRERQKKMYERL